MQHPLETAKRLFEQCELEWCVYAEHYLARNSEHWASRVAPWHTLLSSQDIEIVERILQGSVFQDWWEIDHAVCLYDYSL